MTKEEFKALCKKEFEKRGFMKKKNAYFKSNSEFLCSLHLQKSDYGPVYYLNYDFFFGDYTNAKQYPTEYESDLYGRFYVMSKTLDSKTKETYLGTQFEYEEATEDDFMPYIAQSFESRIDPPFAEGKSYFLKYVSHYWSPDAFYYVHPLKNEEEVMKILQE